jgi:putative ABC transport system ATP-binding protein
LPLIECRDLRKNYEMGDEIVHALRGVDLSIEKGEYLAIMGPSGSGKSTLMNMLGCLDTPSEGVYELDGERVDEMRDDELADIRNLKIGFVFQTFNLLARATALANVELPLIYAGVPAYERHERARVALAKVGLADRVTHKPNEMSGGERQRVAMARALVTEPQLILADEPTGNLDTRTSHEIMALLKDIHANGNTILLVTHEEDISRYARRIVRLRDGVVESDVVNPEPR